MNLKTGEYKVLVVDPPWDQGKTGKRSVRPNQGTDLEYPTMTLDEIKDGVPIGEWTAEQALMWLWVTNSRSRSSGKPIIVQGFELLDHWGFRYYTMVTWNKGNGVCPFGPYRIVTEHCLFAYRGKLDTREHPKGQMKTLIETASRGHSVKPQEFYTEIAKHFNGPRLDVFARSPHNGFDGWGNEYDDSEFELKPTRNNTGTRRS